MISEVVMPQMGADMTEGTIVRWLKAEGDKVARGEPIAEIETDKANIEIETFEAGILRKILAHEGDVLPVGELIAVVADAGEDISRYESDGSTAAEPAATAPAESAPAPASAAEPVVTAPAEPAPASATAAEPAATAPAEPAPAAASAAPAPAASAPAPEHDVSPQRGERLRASPVARRLAEERGVDITELTGSGPDGRIVKRDVEAAESAPPAASAPSAAFVPAVSPGEDIVQQQDLSRMRQTIARRMQQSKQQAPHYYLTVDIDMTSALDMLAGVNKALGEAGRLTINDLIILATSRALLRHPRFNAYWLEDHLELHSQVNIGIAVALADGLVVPAILDAAHKSLQQLSLEARDVAGRARSGSLSAEEYSASTFTISNLGAFGVDVLVAIINPPQVGILGIGTAREKPVVVGGQIVVRTMMSTVLSADHRATDGAEGARFLQTLRQMLETPGMMLA